MRVKDFKRPIALRSSADCSERISSCSALNLAFASHDASIPTRISPSRFPIRSMLAFVRVNDATLVCFMPTVN
jgi:hypothetical protein